MREIWDKLTSHLGWVFLLAALLTYLGILQWQVLNLQDDLDSVGRDVRGVPELQKDLEAVRTELSTLRTEVARLQPAPAVLSETAPSALAEGPSAQRGEAAAPTPTPPPRLTGQASVIGDDRAGEPMFCEGEPYDPQANVIAVATTVQEELLPCGSVVRVYRQLAWSDQVLEEDATVTDTFSDPPGFDIESDMARKFNLSRATANALEIYGVETVTVELIKKGSPE